MAWVEETALRAAPGSEPLRSADGDVEGLLAGRVRVKGLTVVPLSVYLKGSRIKLEIALVQGKQLHDKREAAKRRRLDEEARRAMAGEPD